MPADHTESSIARLEVSRILRADPDALCAALRDPGWLGRVSDPEDGDRATAAGGGADGLSRVQTDLAFDLTDDPKRLTFRKAAVVDVGASVGPDGGCVGRVEWRAASLAPLFPVFSGTVTAHDGGLHLAGAYAPPGGGVGVLVDRAFLHHVARRTAIWFLDRLIEELDRRG